MLLYGALVVYQLDAQERGVVFRFGEAQSDVVLPGLHWNPPIIDVVEKVAEQVFIPLTVGGSPTSPVPWRRGARRSGSFAGRDDCTDCKTDSPRLAQHDAHYHRAAGNGKIDGASEGAAGVDGGGAKDFRRFP